MGKNAPFEVPVEVSQITETLKEAGFEAYLIGGCVRDLFLGKKPKDWDVTTDAKPDQIVTLFSKTFYENDYGTVGVVNENAEDATLKIVEVTPYRTEGKYSDKRRPDFVSFDATLEDDLKRRDFTINAIALDFEKNVVVDPFFGRKDIQVGVIRTVGTPLDRFQEDGLRLLRAIRIHAELGFAIEPETERAIVESAHLLKDIAVERVRDEFVRIIESDHPMSGVLAMRKFGLIKYVLPEMERAVGVEQNKAHAYDVWTHLLKTLQHTAERKFNLEVRLAALFHDISKPETRQWSEEKREWTFYSHEVVGERVTRETLKRLRFPNGVIEKVASLVRWHMFFSDTERITHSAVRRLLAHVGRENVWDLMSLRAADRIGTGRPKENPYRLRKYKAMVEEVMSDPISVGMLKIDGKRIMELTGTKPGPKVGHILHALLEKTLDNPEINKTDVLEKVALELVKLSDKNLEKIGEAGKKKKQAEEEKKRKNIRRKYWVD